MNLNGIIFPLVLTASAIAAGMILYAFISFFAGRWAAQGLKASIAGARAPLRLLLPVLSFSAVQPFLDLPSRIRLPLLHALHLIVIGLAAWLAVRIVHIVQEVFLSRYDVGARDNLKARRVATQARVIERIVALAILLVAVSFMFMSFPRVRQIGVSLLASAGIIGIILGFAAQKTLANLVAGIQLAFTQPIRLDDVVIVEGEWGRVEEINLVYVVVCIWDQRRLILPISYFLEKPFQNWTRTAADILGSVFLSADYTVPVAAVRMELTRILESSPLWDRKVNVLQVTHATERSVELRALMSARDSSQAWDLRCEVREKLLAYLQREHPACLPRIRLEMEKPGV